MADAFSRAYNTVSDPATRGVAIVPSDTADLKDIPKGLYIGTGGHITMIGVDEPADAKGITYKNFPTPGVFPFRPRRILATGTTASDIVALY